MADQRYTVTVTDKDGTVIFIGSPSGPEDTLAIVQAEGKSARLRCSVPDKTEGLRRETAGATDD